MSNQKLYTQFKQLAQDQQDMVEADLWPAIKSRVNPVLNKQRQEKSSKVHTSRRLGRTWAAVSASLALLVAFFTITPIGRVWAQEFLRFFERKEDNKLNVSDSAPSSLIKAVPESVPHIVPEAISCLDSPFPNCTLAEAQKHVDFPILFPTELPPSFSFEGVQVLDNGVLLAFSAPRGGYSLFETPFTPEELIMTPVGEATEIKVLSVNGQHAEFVEGSWYGSPNEDGEILWNNNDSVRTLIWTLDGIEYKLVSSAGKVHNSYRPSAEEMVAFAETLTPGTKTEDASADGLSLIEAEKKAGFTITLPSQVPPRIIKTNTTFNPEQGVICQHYSDSQGINNDTLIVAASRRGLLDPYSFSMSDQVGPNGEVFSPTMFVEHVEMPGALNNKAIYLHNGIQIDTLCGEEGMNTNHGIMWHKDDMSYYIFGYMDGNMGYPFVTYNELLNMASEISDLEIPGIKRPDPQRLTSLKDAQSVWGSKINFPKKMLAGVHFDHYAYREFDNEDRFLIGVFSKNPVTEFVTIVHQPRQLALSQQYGDVNQTVWDLPAVYQSVCWGDPFDPFAGCHVNLIWEDDNIHYELAVRTLKMIPVEQVLEIAESMKP